MDAAIYTLIKKANNYSLEEPCIENRKIISHLLQELNDKNILELKSRLNGFLNFGTAGIRAKMSAGYNYINLVTIYHIAKSILLYIKINNLQKRPVIIGYDARHNSIDYAHEMLRVFSGDGLEVFLFNEPCPTPALCFKTKELKASMGLMITASHNPKDDNGIKFFDALGGQISKKATQDIKDLFSESLNNLRTDYKNDYPIKNIYFQDMKSYFSLIRKNRYFNDGEIDKEIKILYTSLHGVGKKYFIEACEMLGFNNIFLLEKQCDMDGSFPTVRLPNPEEDGTMDLALKSASVMNPDVIIANDPDADRFLAYTKISNDDYYRLSGNEIGVILGYYAINKSKEKNIKNASVASTIVSSRMLKKIAEKLGIEYQDSLTGFGNIKENNIDKNLIFAYEEAIGFLGNTQILDKDGISSAVNFLEIFSKLKKDGRSIVEVLENLYRQFGLYRTYQWHAWFTKNDLIKAMDYIRKISIQDIENLFKIADIKKYDLKEHFPHPYGQAQTDMVIWQNGKGFRMIVRPSGTEPKIKFYMELNKKMDNKISVLNEWKLLDKDLVNKKKLFMGFIKL